jgi:hypothetical protein
MRRLRQDDAYAKTEECGRREARIRARLASRAELAVRDPVADVLARLDARNKLIGPTKIRRPDRPRHVA